MRFDRAHRELLNYGRRQIVGPIRQRIAARKLNASGNLSRSVEWTVSSSADVLRGTGLANLYWQWAGNGRPPGGMPPVSKLERWARRKGMQGAGFAIARKIAQEGSKDYREGNTNVFEDITERTEPTLEHLATALRDDVAVDIFQELERFKN